jgi:hypothetical protein
MKKKHHQLNYSNVSIMLAQNWLSLPPGWFWNSSNAISLHPFLATEFAPFAA